jgi:hypothetical protein
MTDDPERAVRQYLDKNPDADAIDVISDFVVGPDERELVEEIIAERRDGQDDDVDEPTPSCARPSCDEPRRNDHRHSLCADCGTDPTGAGDITQPDLDSPNEHVADLRVTDGDGENRKTASITSDCNGRDVAAEAAAVAGDEPDREPEASPWPDLPDDQSMDAGADDGEDEPGVDEDGSVDAAALMGGSDSEYAADPAESHAQQRERSPDSSGTTLAKTASLLPLQQLDALPQTERRRLARQRGLDWPTTEEARDRLESAIFEVMRHEDDRVIDAPTALGKSYTTAATRWGARDDVTGGQPVVHLSETRDARDEAIETALEDGSDPFVLRSRDEACPVAAGRNDPQRIEDNGLDRQPISMDGQPASQWINEMCQGRGLPFSDVHRHLEEHNDQDVDLPCCTGETEHPADIDVPASTCPAIYQWEAYRNSDPSLVIATHNFAHVPGLRTNTNVVIDEQPDFVEDFGADTPQGITARVREAVGAFLEAADAPVQSWEQFVTLARYDGYGDDAGREREALQDALDHDPDREWYFSEPRAHTLAPALARAIFHAEERANGRLGGKTRYQPPRLDEDARDDDGWNWEWVSVVIGDDNTVRTVRTVPDLQPARSVIGLDAHPSVPVWAANTLPHIDRKEVLGREERQLWRRYERGLRVVQVGDATRPLASGQYFDRRGFSALADHLRDEYGADFRTMLTASSVESQATTLMKEAGVADPETMHFGEERSRNDFAGEPVGLVEGCIDPGDDMVLDLLAELDLDAEPERSDGECDDCDGDGCRACGGTGHKRAHGRGWTGDDAESAREILASVRENHTAQAAGRYARDADDPDSHATVFVRTDAMPPGFADVQVPGVFWTFAPKQRDVVEALRELDEPASAYRLADEAGVSKQHAYETLERLVEDGHVDALEGVGDHGATLYADAGVPNTGVVDLEDEEAAVSPAATYGTTRTWLLAIRDPTPVSEVSSTSIGGRDDADRSVWDWEAGVEGGG